MGEHRTWRLARQGLRLNSLFVMLLAVALSIRPAGSLASGPTTAPAGCDFDLGFATLRNLVVHIEGPSSVGTCLESEIHTPNGDGFQRTTGGLMIWRKASNWTGFTNGRHSWINGPLGLQKRLAPERLPWEAGGPDIVTFLSAPWGELPPAVDVGEMVRQVETLHMANDGCTFNPHFGNLAGKSLYAVSLYPDLGVVLDGKEILMDLLLRVVVDNQALLQDPRVSVGTWFDGDGNKTYLDISATIPNRQQAIELGKRYNQIAIFALDTFEEISTGGTGERIENLPPPPERLPELSLQHD